MMYKCAVLYRQSPWDLRAMTTYPNIASAIHVVLQYHNDFQLTIKVKWFVVIWGLHSSQLMKECSTIDQNMQIILIAFHFTYDLLYNMVC